MTVQVQIFSNCRELHGRQDGAAVDVGGCYWFASVGGWSVVRVTPEGIVLRIIEMPIEKPNKVMLDGSGLDIMYATIISAGIHDLRSQPGAGNLFGITGIGTSGMERRRYAGLRLTRR